MNLVIDCFALIKEDENTKVKYERVKRIIECLAKENSKRNQEHHIMVMGNMSNQNDFDVEGTTFLLMDKDPESNWQKFKWKHFGIASLLPKLGSDRVLFTTPCLPVATKNKQIVLIFKNEFPGLQRLLKKADRILLDEEPEDTSLKNELEENDKVRLLSSLKSGDVSNMEINEYWEDVFDEIG